MLYFSPRSRKYSRRLALPILLLIIPQLVFADIVRDIVFPVQGNYTFRNDFLEPRGGGTRQHQGNDIIAEKMTPLVAVVDGVINYVAIPQASWGYEVEIQDDEGYSYDYLHINNDTPGTDDGNGGVQYAYAPGVIRGARVSRGFVIGWVGDSGNAENTVPHLHFEMHDPNHNVINPYASLVKASGGVGVSDSAPSTNTVDPTVEERNAQLRYIFTKDMSYGDESNEVRQLQRTLAAFGHFKNHAITSYFGPVTEGAVMSYQKKKGLPETGEVGLITRRAINNDLGTYDPNDYVPHFTDAEKRAILIAQLQQQIAVLLAQLKAIRGY